MGIENKSKNNSNEITSKESSPNISSNNNENELSNDYTIIHAQQIGKKFRFEIKYKNGNTVWLSDHQINDNKIKEFIRKQHRTTRSNAQNISTSYYVTIILILFYLICVTTGTRIEDKFIHCQSRGPNRIINPRPDCKQPNEIKRDLAKHNTILDEILHRKKLPSDIFIVSRNKYFLNEIGYECIMTRKTTYLNETWFSRQLEVKKRNQYN